MGRRAARNLSGVAGVVEPASFAVQKSFALGEAGASLCPRRCPRTAGWLADGGGGGGGGDGDDEDEDDKVVERAGKVKSEPFVRLLADTEVACLRGEGACRAGELGCAWWLLSGAV